MIDVTRIHLIRVARVSGPILAVATAVLALVGCGARSYAPAPLDGAAFLGRAQAQSYGAVRVRAAVPSAEESEALLGIPVYDRGIQPVWLEVQNGSDARIRFAPVGVDEIYFSPMEVPYMHKRRFSGKTLAKVERYFYETAMPRTIFPGQTVSGFVYTHREPGTKSINIDLFSPTGRFRSFVFFIEVPGFVADHQRVDFNVLYGSDQLRDVVPAELRAELESMSCCSTNESGDRTGIPVNLALVGKGDAVLYALLRAGWRETERSQGAKDRKRAHYLYGREPDAIFRITRAASDERNELRVWMSPLRVEGQPVWVAQIVHYIGADNELVRALFDPRLDPDLDSTRNYMLQRMWYAQTLQAYGWVSTGDVVPMDDLRESFEGSSHFTDGYRLVLWLTASPVSTNEARHVGWDEPPLRGGPTR